MFEHLSRDGAINFLNEARRVLSDDGIIRIAVPDLEKSIATYNENTDADYFMDSIFVRAPSINSLKEKINLLFSGYRHHQWMYDGKSLVAILNQHNFSYATIQCNGRTLIQEVGKLDLFERSEESVIIEAMK